MANMIDSSFYFFLNSARKNHKKSSPYSIENSCKSCKYNNKGYTIANEIHEFYSIKYSHTVTIMKVLKK